MNHRAPTLLLTLLLGLSAALPAQATLRRPDLGPLSTGEANDGTLTELWFSVVDPTTEVSYTLDLGVTIAQLRLTNADAGSAKTLQTAGNNISATFTTASDANRDYAFWIIDSARDTAWSQYRAVANLTTSVWAVMGADTVGPTNNSTGRSVLVTIGQGNEAVYRDLTNAVYNNFKGTTDAYVRVGLNNRPNHAVEGDVTGDLESSIAINGSSFDTKALNPDAYFGNATDAYTALNLPGITNPVGQSAWFYDITRSGSSNLAKVIVNEFDNLAGDSYWGFTAEAGNTGRFLLSYTTQRFVSQAETARAQTFENSFAHLAGVLSVAHAVGHGDEVVSLADGFLRRLASRRASQAGIDDGALKSVQLFSPAAVSAVPEPSAWALMGLGLAALIGRTRRSRRRDR